MQLLDGDINQDEIFAEATTLVERCRTQLDQKQIDRVVYVFSIERVGLDGQFAIPPAFMTRSENGGRTAVEH